MLLQDVDEDNLLAAYEVDRSTVMIQSELGQGQFGKVLKAVMKNVLPGQAKSVVAVKTLKGDRFSTIDSQYNKANLHD